MGMRRKKERKRNPRPVIIYPPLTTRRWIPPDLRRKKKIKPPQLRYEKPPGVTQKLAISSLGQVWHDYKILDGRTILTGHFSQTHKRYRPRSNGYQTPCNCIIAIVCSKYFRMAKWTKNTIDWILDKGDELYMSSVIHQEDRRKNCFALSEVYPTFFYEDKKITITVKGHKFKGKLFEDTDGSQPLIDVIRDFFDDHDSGILSTQGKHISIWLEGNHYYLFDPTEHTPKGYLWKGVPGQGFAMVLRFADTDPLVTVVHENVSTVSNSEFTITPCSILRTVKIEVIPPDNVIKPHCFDFKPSEFKIVPARPPIKEELLEEEEEEEDEVEVVLQVVEPTEGKFDAQDEIEEYSPEVGQAPSKTPSEFEAAGLEYPTDVIPRKKISRSQFPLERAKAESVTYFTNLISDKFGILRASTHQCDSRVTNLNGKQRFGSAFAALTMLRIYKSKYWFRRILDDILKLGIIIHNDSQKELAGRTESKVTTMCKEITFENRTFKPNVDEYTVIGALQSQKTEVLDLLPALQEFFGDNQTGVITGPLTLAVWYEDGLFYMFDPNERDKNGLSIIKSIQIGSELQVLDYVPGVACVTWYSDLKDLVEVYMRNVEKPKRRDHFIISRVYMDDYIAIPKDWYSFTGVVPGKWIIRGTINQRDRQFDNEYRGTQSTAISAMALAYAKLKHVKTWTIKEIDEILIKGTKYYIQCVEKLQKENKFHNPSLLVSELSKKFAALGVEVVLDINDCIVNGLIDAKDENDALNLKKGIRNFFMDNETGILSSRNISIAIWKTDEIFYYFDSHSRDENGVFNYFGCACLLRFLNTDDLARAIEANLDPSTNNTYNISRVETTIWESEGGVVRPPLNHFTEVSEVSAILISQYHERSPEFKLNVGKQTIPMCYASLGMMKLIPSATWSRDILDEVLYVGDKLYTDTMIEREKLGLDDTDEADINNCLDTFNIGFAKFTMNKTASTQGQFDYDFEPAMTNFLNLKLNDEDKREALIISELYTVATWTDNDLFYLFDPKPRTETGEVLGKDEWSEKYLGEEEGGDSYNEYLKSMVLGGGGDATEAVSATDSKPQRRSIGSQISETEEPDIGPNGKHTAKYWKAQENELGKACIMWFAKQEKLIQHILENVPPAKRDYTSFEILPIDVVAKTELKSVFDPSNAGTRIDLYSGNWYFFKEIDHGRWILRGSMDHTHIMFPEHNRGRQSLAMCYAALSYAKRFAISKFKSVTVDDILKYGDRIHTSTRRIRFKEIRKNKDFQLSTVEIENLLNSKVFDIDDIVRAFCIGPDQMRIDITPAVITGDIRADKVGGVINVREGLERYFAENVFGILSCKNLTVAIWRGAKVYFMFDPNSCGPSGIRCVNGEACITRYLNLQVLVDVFLQNLVKDGKNCFVIHQVRVIIQPCPREPKPEEKERTEPPLYNGYNMMMPGKFVLRGTLNLDDPIFGRGQNAQCAPIAVIALTMTLIHKSSNWTKPIVDEILIFGDELYTATLDTLGFDFNPWEQGMTLRLVNKNYKVGTLKANCELRTMDQRGIIDIKHPTIQNLRQGIERFFDENTHGVIETETLTVAIWEEDEQPGLIYMYDPNPRGPAGLFIPGGTACVVSFETPKMAADHFIANIADKSKRTGEYVITPVEIVVGSMRTKPKKEKFPCPKRPGDLKPSPTPCEKKKLRQMAAIQRQKKQAQKLAKIGKFEFHPLPNGDAILRGSKSQIWKGYSENSRGNQDLPNCFAAFVVNRLVPILAWHYKHIDMALDVGDQLYKDSYITYNPKDPKLGLENILRRIYIKEVRISLKVYKPVMSNVLTHFNLEMALLNYFQQENFAILSANNEHVALFFKEGLYYMFDPHNRDVDGNKCLSCMVGAACLMRFQTIPNIVNKFIDNVTDIAISESTYFTITLITVGNIVKDNQAKSVGGGSKK